ncbi:RNase adapter RapZ [Zoogloea sp.]|uniref:RNase adapter RapZ n=1 Tax=Zoogloea sp. TaxID=49181 RepID=UPI0026180B94|nr:RNase adapter RapZ [Zoogloea sp.]MDD3352921.1 RNase adapter RapZ [Zoogloea sp.]
MQLVLISGLSGSGKSVALNVMEDCGHYVVDNLPSALLPQLVSHLRGAGYQRIAVAVDVRSGASISALPRQVETLKAMVADVRFLFLDARDETLIARFSETRRKHPLGDGCATLAEAIAREREALALISELGQRLDTSELSANTLRNWVKAFMGLEAGSQIAVLFQSFGFKHGIPLDADLVFDVRCLPNPYYDAALRPLTGRDQPVIDFLNRVPEVGQMIDDIYRFVASWLPAYVNDNRSYLTIAIGCTGGQHRSVFIAEQLAERFKDNARVQVRHRSFK